MIPELITKWLDTDDGLAELVEPFTWKGIIVPSGFVTDGCSVPQIAHTIIPKWGTGTKAGVIHDKIYVTHEITKEEADRLFYECLKDLDVDRILLWMMYQAVKIGGDSAWETRSAFGLNEYRKYKDHNLLLLHDEIYATS